MDGKKHRDNRIWYDSYQAAKKMKAAGLIRMSWIASSKHVMVQAGYEVPYDGDRFYGELRWREHSKG